MSPNNGSVFLKQICHLHLRKPYRSFLHTHLQPHLSLRLIEHNFAFFFVFRHFHLVINKNGPLRLRGNDP